MRTYVLTFPFQVTAFGNGRIGKLNGIERASIQGCICQAFVHTITVKLKQSEGAAHTFGDQNTSGEWVSPQAQVLILHLLLPFQIMDPTFQATTAL